MRKSLLLGAIVLSACAPPAPSATEDETRKIALAVFEAFNAHDWSKMESLYSDSVKLQDPAYPGGKTGKAGMTDFYQSVADIHDEVQNIVVQNNTAVVEFVSTGTMNGNKFSLSICTVLIIEQGLVVKDHTYYDATN